jgi:perosamine synthetase
MTEYRIKQWEPDIGAEEKIELANMIDSGWLTEAELTRKFEQALAQHCNMKYCVATTSGGIALFMSLLAVGVKRNSVVVMPDYQMIALAHAVRMVGAKPYFVDVSAKSGVMNDLIDLVADAIVPVHMNGRVADFTSALDETPVIADSCQALGSELSSRQIGVEADCACFSFHPSKIITTGQGGAVVTDNEEIYEACCRIKDYGRYGRGSQAELPHYSAFWGMNFRFTEMQAAIGLAQIRKLSKRIVRMREIYDRYRSAFKDCAEIEQTIEQEGYTPWCVDILLKNVRPEVVKFVLAAKNIETRLPYYPLHKQPLYRTFGNFEGSNYWSSHCLWLPSSSKLTNEEVDTVIEAVLEVLK